MVKVIKSLKYKKYGIKRNSQIDLNWGKNSKFSELLTFLGSFPELLQLNLYSDELYKSLSEEAQEGVNMILDEYDYLYSEWLRTLFVKNIIGEFGQKIKLYKDGTEITIGSNNMAQLINRPLKRTDFDGKPISVNLKQLDNKFSNIFFRQKNSQLNKAILTPNELYNMFPDLFEKSNDIKIQNILKEKRIKLRKKLKKNEKYIIPCIYEFVHRERVLIGEGLNYDPKTGDPTEHKYFNGD